MYDDLVDLFIELAVERENNSHMGNFLKRHLGKGDSPTPYRGEMRGSETPGKSNKGRGKGRG